MFTVLTIVMVIAILVLVCRSMGSVDFSSKIKDPPETVALMERMRKEREASIARANDKLNDPRYSAVRLKKNRSRQERCG